MNIKIPELSLVVLVGVSGSGKSSFAGKHFLPTEVLSSDFCRGLVCDDENDQTVTKDAFDLLHTIACKRLSLGRLTVVDATNVQFEARKPLVKIAREYHSIPVAIVFNLPRKLCQSRNEKRSDRNFGSHVVRQQASQLKRSLKRLKREGFRHVFVFNSPEEVEAAEIKRVPLWNDKREERGPFDIIGDVHGCCNELEALLEKLGYEREKLETPDPLWGEDYYAHPEGRKAVFLGDLVDRGPRVLDVLKLARNMSVTQNALIVPGNHDMKFLRKLWGKIVQITHGLDKSLGEMEGIPQEFKEDSTKAFSDFLHSLVSHYVLDNGRLVVAHAGMKQEMQGRGSAKVRDFALYGETTGETDEFGLPVRCEWALDYRGPASVVYGHTPVPRPEWLNRTINIDTGCVFGGKLTGLRWPEKDLVSVAAFHTYCEPAKPFLEQENQAPALSAQHEYDDLLDADDVLGKRIVSTRLRPNITIREENAIAAFEIMSRFAINPKWLIYLPPTMSPCETAVDGDYLEYPTSAFSYYRSLGVPKVVCEAKHMGSRAVVIVCRDEETAFKRFGITEEVSGTVYTRTGRSFFDDALLEKNLVSILQGALSSTGFWEKLETDWACLDCELMPWSAKARELIRNQYAAVGAAASASLSLAISALKKTSLRKDMEKDFKLPENSSAKPADIGLVLNRFTNRQTAVEKYIEAYKGYCWPVNSISDLRLAPFHLLATEGKTHFDKDHLWHMEVLREICASGSPVLMATPFKVVDVTSQQSEKELTRWWEEITERGEEGMVVKPLDFVAKGKRGLVQPAVKVRGREYLRIIYGPDYTFQENLLRLRSRSLGRKRSLALREFALGLESLERFVRQEPLRRVHECVFGVLALESEPVDPRL